MPFMRSAVFSDFNPRSHERSDNQNTCRHSMSVYFNPRSHERSDSNGEHFTIKQMISIHAPTRGATYSNGWILFHFYFNPRSHERSDLACCLLSLVYGISIHAPTRGATVLFTNSKQPRIISIHAPTRGATMHGREPDKGTGNFNPRSHERSDLFSLCVRQE